jgi:hypothetical protein
MHRSIRFLATSLVAAVCLWPAAAGAQSTDSGQLEQVRAAYASAGYQVEAPLTWDWTRPPVSTFRVRDPGHDHDRVLMVLVYPSSSAAIAGRLQAQAHDEALSGGQPIIDSGVGPHLVFGYGPSTWRGNVALVQSTDSELARIYSTEAYRDMDVDRAPLAESAPLALPVDLDFLQALDTSVINL